MGELVIIYDSTKLNTFQINRYNSTPLGIIYNGNLVVDWGDGNTTTETSSKFNHTYSSNGIYTIRMVGDITALGASALTDLTGIMSIIIPSSVTTINNGFLYMFEGSGSLLSSITFESSNPPSFKSNAIAGMPICTIYVPRGSLSAYTSASNYPSSSSYTYVEYDVINYVLSSVGSVDVIDGDATIQVTLTADDEPMGGETITLTDSESNSYTATTDSNGVATFNLTDIEESDVYTASYTGADDINISVIVHDYSLSLVDDVFYTCNGVCTVKALLTDSNVGVSGATVTLTGLSSNMTSSTDSEGLVSFNISNINENKSITVKYGLEEDNGTIIYYNPNTLNGSLACLGMRLVDRLEQKGIEEISFTDGLTTLANEILNITPSVGGIDLTTSINCNAEDTVFLNTPFIISGFLEADYDDTSQLNVDLDGYLTGATVKIYNGNTLLGTTVTGNDGKYNYAYTPTSVGNLSLKAVFEGTEYYDSCMSTVKSVTVEELTILELSISSDKTILSRNDNDIAVITASLTSNNVGVGGKTINYEILDSSNNQISNGSDVTDNNGEIHINYTSTGIGDITVTVGYNELSESLIIEDCIYAEIPQIDTSRNGTTYHLLNGDVIGNLPVTYKIEFDMKTSTQPTMGNEQRIYWSPTDLWSGNGQPSNAMFVGYAYSNEMEGGKRNNGSTSSSVRSCSINTWYNIRIEKINNNSAFYIYVDNSYFTWWTVDNAKQFSTWEFGFALWSETTYSVKNIKIKPL